MSLAWMGRRAVRYSLALGLLGLLVYAIGKPQLPRVGFATAEWLAEQGAGKVILLSRQPPAPDIAARIALWRDKGVDMIARQGDVSSWSTVTAVVAEVASSLRGVIHCANVLDDAPVGRQDACRVHRRSRQIR